MAYYSDIEVKSCAQHIEAKQLANKHWNRWLNISDKLADVAINATVNDLEKVKHLGDKADKLYNEFQIVRKGINRCCESE